jgi:hypothetical protein
LRKINTIKSYLLCEEDPDDEPPDDEPDEDDPDEYEPLETDPEELLPEFDLLPEDELLLYEPEEYEDLLSTLLRVGTE